MDDTLWQFIYTLPDHSKAIRGTPFFYIRRGAGNDDKYKGIERLLAECGIHADTIDLNSLDPKEPSYWNYITRQAYKELRANERAALECGLTVEEFLDLDCRSLNSTIIAYQHQRETEINDKIINDVRLAIKVSEAVWGSKHVSDVKPVDFKLGEKDITKTEQELRYEEAFAKACKQYNIT